VLDRAILLVKQEDSLDADETALTLAQEKGYTAYIESSFWFYDYQ